MSRVVIHIEKLVIDGQTELNKAVLVENLEAALTELLATQGWPTTWRRGGYIPLLRANSELVAGPDAAESAGRQVAQLLLKQSNEWSPAAKVGDQQPAADSGSYFGNTLSRGEA